MIGMDSPFLQFALLALISAGMRQLLLRRGDSPTASGAIAMAIGIFVLGAWQHLPLASRWTTRLLTFEGLIVWGFTAAAYIRSARCRRFATHLTDPVGTFAVGTWVAGTAVLARLVLIAVPEWRPLALSLTVLALAVWVWYLTLIVRRYPLIWRNPVRLRTTGRILLATVSTQSILLLLVQIFQGALPEWFAAGLILLGYGLYGLGVTLIVQRYVHERGWTLADDWDNTNCILHGAMSITGLTIVESGALPIPVATATWLWVLVVFILVEGIECARLVDRVRRYGWVGGLGRYHVSQWARNFTFGMFYAFTARLAALPATGAAEWVGDLQVALAATGQYLILLLLLIEIGLFLRHNLEWHLVGLIHKGSSPAVRQ